MEDALYHLVGFYRRSPDWVKRLVGTGYGLLPYNFRYGKKYTIYRQLAVDGRAWTEEQHSAWQLNKLQSLIRYAWENIPYYRKTFREAGVQPTDLQTIDDMRSFPTLTREDIRSNFDDLVVPDRPGLERLYTATSGSSGVPLELFHHKGVTRSKERAFLYELWSRFGYEPTDTAVLFPWRGDRTKRQAMVLRSD